MNHLVLDLQRDATNASVPISDLLRKARMVAMKLKLPGVCSWIEQELHGYSEPKDVPSYRVLVGDVRAQNPVNGFLMPVRFPDPDLQARISKCYVTQSLGSLYETISLHKGDYLQVPFSEHQLSAFRNAFSARDRGWVTPFRKIDAGQVSAIFDAVRNRILDWALEPESQGILGEQMTFTTAEQQKAASMTTINIGTVSQFSGVIGSVADSTLSIDNVHAIDAMLQERGFTPEQRTELQLLIAEHKSAPKETRLAVAAKGVRWVVENAEKLGALAALVRDYFGR